MTLSWLVFSLVQFSLAFWKLNYIFAYEMKIVSLKSLTQKWWEHNL